MAGSAVKETVLEFGPDRRLVGVLTRPPRAAGGPTDVVVVITNSGIIHRVGANRVHVRLARSLAANGVPCLRYDLPGIGDSERLTTGGDVESDNLAATRAAVDALVKQRVGSRIVMVGLCSGADHSFRAMRVDPRIVGAVLIDPTAMFSTTRHRMNLVRRLLRRALRPAMWGRLLSGRYRLSRATLNESISDAGPGAPRSLTRADHPEAWTDTRDALQEFIRREAELLLITTHHNERVYSYRQQLQDAFPSLRELSRYLSTYTRPQSDHTFSAEVDRRFLETALLAWLRDRVLPRSAPP